MKILRKKKSTLHLADKSEKLEAKVKQLSKLGLSKLEIYTVFLEFFSYIQYRIERFHLDLIADSILDRLWGGGWDKGKKLLPNEPDICDIIQSSN